MMLSKVHSRAISRVVRVCVCVCVCARARVCVCVRACVLCALEVREAKV